jgi:hypothetical protein
MYDAVGLHAGDGAGHADGVTHDADQRAAVLFLKGELTRAVADSADNVEAFAHEELDQVLAGETLCPGDE